MKRNIYILFIIVGICLTFLYLYSNNRYSKYTNASDYNSLIDMVLESYSTSDVKLTRNNILHIEELDDKEFLFIADGQNWITCGCIIQKGDKYIWDCNGGVYGFDFGDQSYASMSIKLTTLDKDEYVVHFGQIKNPKIRRIAIGRYDGIIKEINDIRYWFLIRNYDEEHQRLTAKGYDANNQVVSN